MRILKHDIKHGSITVLPEVLDDFWVLYNIIIKGDKVYAKTSREIRFGSRYDRPEKGRRVSVFLSIDFIIFAAVIRTKSPQSWP